jgi:hypothetical protein
MIDHHVPRLAGVAVVMFAIAATDAAAGAPARPVVEVSVETVGGSYGVQGLVLADDGALYGTQPDKGRFDGGMIFKLRVDAFSRIERTINGDNKPTTEELTPAYVFGDPRTNLSFAGPGKIFIGADRKLYVNALNFYNANGNILRFDPATSTAEAIELETPNATLGKCFARGTDGVFWFTGEGEDVFHSRGGEQDFGTVAAAHDWKAVIDGGDGYLYGTTIDTLEKVKKDGSDHAVLHKFTGAEHGANQPTGDPVAVGGRIYGYARPDNSTHSNTGIFYRVNRDGSEFIVIETLDFTPGSILAGDNQFVYGVNSRGFFRVDDRDPKIDVLLPSKKRHEVKAIAIGNDFAYALAYSSIFRIPLPRAAPTSKTASASFMPNSAMTLSTPSSSPTGIAASAGGNVFHKRETVPSGSQTLAPQSPGTASATPPADHRPADMSSTATESGQMAGSSRQGTSPTNASTVTQTYTPASSASQIAEQVAQGYTDATPDALVSMYADTVDYLDSGRINNDAVRAQVQEYFSRWPQRQWTLTGPVKVESMGASVQKVVFKAQYDVANPASNQHASGIATETLVVAPDSTGAMKIISQREQTGAKATGPASSGKEKHHRRRHEKVYDGRVAVPWR